MLFERIESAGLAQHSYLIGDQQTAVVIDPRRDGEVYVELAAQAGMRIEAVLETHRHEDFIVGSVPLAAHTNAEIWHADAQLPYQYGQAVTPGQIWHVGRLTLEALHTPGHTEGSMSYLLREPSGAPWAVFTGDALFAGEVGRVDFLGMARAPELAGMLYDAIFEKLLPLGDGVLICPAHGAGSACGSAIGDRTWTTVGLERALNTRLQLPSREAFIEAVARQLPKPPYFERVERINLTGPEPSLTVPPQPLLAAKAFAAADAEAFVLDTRPELAFSAQHIAGAQFVGVDRLSMLGGWFLPIDEPLLIVAEDADAPGVVRQLARLGYDCISGLLAGAMTAWHTAGYPSVSLPEIGVRNVVRSLEAGDALWLLDVRSAQEFTAGHVAGAHNIPLQQLTGRRDEVPGNKQVVAICGTGARAMIGASALQRHGWPNMSVMLGGLTAWSSAGLPLAQ